MKDEVSQIESPSGEGQEPVQAGQLSVESVENKLASRTSATGTNLESSQVGVVDLSFPTPDVAVIRLGPPGERVVTLTPERLDSLEVALSQAAAKGVRGVVFSGPIPGMFTVGADINLIASVSTKEEGVALASRGQAVFDKVASFPGITVAAISGPCVGGGCELALACRYRVMVNDSRTIIGLPEVKLGIIPGFGGTQRLVPLVGIAKGLDAILTGRTYKGVPAKDLGLVDLLVAEDQLIDRSISIAAGATNNLPTGASRSLPLLERMLTYTELGRNFIVKKARAQIANKGSEHYPALEAAIEAVLYGLRNGIQDGLKNEARVLGELVVSPTCRALVHLFFASENAKSLGKGVKSSLENTHALVVGAGVMGAGIAAELARSGSTVVLKDVNQELVEKGRQRVKAIYQKRRGQSQKELDEAFQRIEFSVTGGDSIGNTNLVVEAVFEDLATKEAVLTELLKSIPSDALVASNTSALSISEISRRLPNPERFFGLHFFNPVDKMPLVEVVRGHETKDRTLLKAAAVVVSLRKLPIVVEDRPGFLVNRTLTPYLNEALWLLFEGVNPQAIERAALQFGMPMGPLRLLDEVGLDVAAQVATTMYEAFGERFEVPDLVRRLLAEGRKGKKSGAGFYNFDKKTALLSADIESVLGISASRTDLSLEELQSRIILPMVNEAIRCLDEGVAGRPGPEAAFQVDLGSVMGFGFPAYRGGVLYYAENIGLDKIKERINALEAKVGKRLKPAPGLVERVNHRISLRSEKRL